MATLEHFKQLATTPEEISELASEYVLDQEKTTAKIIQMAADKGFDLTSDEIIQHLTQMNGNDEFDDIQLSNEALAAIAGGGRGDLKQRDRKRSMEDQLSNKNEALQRATKNEDLKEAQDLLFLLTTIGI